MGDVVIKYRVMPEGTEVDLKGLGEQITEMVVEPAKLHGMEEIPIAFGLKSLEIVVVINDKEGGFADKVEENIRNIAGVQSIEAIETGLI